MPKSTTFTLRSYTERDQDDVLALNAAEIPRVSSVDVALLQWFAHNAVRFVVGVDDRDRVAGFVLALGQGTSYASLNYRWFHERYTDFLYIDRLVVAPHARRKGLARDFYLHLAQYASLCQLSTMCCEVNVLPANPESLAFHRTEGFTELSERTCDDGKRVVYLQKSLPSAVS